MIPAMIRSRPFLPILSLVLLLTNHSTAFAEVKSAVDWEKFLARHDLVWDKVPTIWHEGAFIGNGLVGSMIYSDGTNALQWDVGRSDVIDKGLRIAIGKFVLVPEQKIQSGDMRLDLWNAEARGNFTSTDSGVPDLRWRSFTHTDKLVTVVEISGRPTRFTFEHSPALPARAGRSSGALGQTPRQVATARAGRCGACRSR